MRDLFGHVTLCAECSDETEPWEACACGLHADCCQEDHAMGDQHPLDKDFAPPAEPCTVSIDDDGWRCVTCDTPWHAVLRLRGWRARWGSPEDKAMEHAREVHHILVPVLRRLPDEAVA